MPLSVCFREVPNLISVCIRKRDGDGETFPKGRKHLYGMAIPSFPGDNQAISGSTVSKDKISCWKLGKGTVHLEDAPWGWCVSNSISLNFSFLHFNTLATESKMY